LLTEFSQFFHHHSPHATVNLQSGDRAIIKYFTTFQTLRYTLLLYLCNIDLDLDSTRIQVDTLGHTPSPFWSV